MIKKIEILKILISRVNKISLFDKKKQKIILSILLVASTLIILLNNNISTVIEIDDTNYNLNKEEIKKKLSKKVIKELKIEELKAVKQLKSLYKKIPKILNSETEINETEQQQLQLLVNTASEEIKQPLEIEDIITDFLIKFEDNKRKGNKQESKIQLLLTRENGLQTGLLINLDELLKSLRDTSLSDFRKLFNSSIKEFLKQSKPQSVKIQSLSASQRIQLLELEPLDEIYMSKLQLTPSNREQMLKSQVNKFLTLKAEESIEYPNTINYFKQLATEKKEAPYNRNKQKEAIDTHLNDLIGKSYKDKKKLISKKIRTINKNIQLVEESGKEISKKDKELLLDNFYRRIEQLRSEYENLK